MKRVKFLTVFLLLMMTVLLTESCKDECDDVICQNDGICVNGICDCLGGFMGEYCENFDPAQIQVLLDGGQSPMDLVNGGIPLDSLYGKRYGGGFIFYFNRDNGTGMAAATEDQSEGVEWGCGDDEVSGSDGVAVGAGIYNTSDILIACIEDGIAARLCAELNLNGKDDWFLPSKGELNLMYINLHEKGLTEFETGLYWSSTESNYWMAWNQSFANGDQSMAYKSNGNHVRAARAF